MKIITNTSRFDTRFLRSLYVATHKHMKRTEGPMRAWPRLCVTVSGKRHANYVSGYAYIKSGPVHLTIGDHATTRTIVKTMFHEGMHVYGYRHSDGGLKCDPHDDDLDVICRDFPDMPLWQRAAKRPPPKDLIAERYARLKAREAAWRTKEKRAANALKKVRAAIRTYERRHSGKL